MALRLEKYRKEEMSPEQRVIYDAIATGPGPRGRRSFQWSTRRVFSRVRGTRG